MKKLFFIFFLLGVLLRGHAQGGDESKVYLALRNELMPYVTGYNVEHDLVCESIFETTRQQIDALGDTFSFRGQIDAFYDLAVARYSADTTAGNDYVDYIKTVAKSVKGMSQPDSFAVLLNLGFLSSKGSDEARRLAAPLFGDYYKVHGEATRSFSLDILKNVEGAIAIIERGDKISFCEGVSFAEAQALAAKSGKLIFIDCYTSWCGPCKKLDTETFTAVKVKEFFDKNFINLKIDMEKGEGVSLMKKFQINSFPTTLLVDSEGEVVFRQAGFKNANEFLNIFTKALEDYKS